MIYLRNLLAAYEIHVADYYLTRQAYVAAANRGRYVVENFQETPSVGDGLAVMTESTSAAPGRTGRHQPETLKLNYPNHPSLVDGQFAHAAEADNSLAEQGHPGPDRDRPRCRRAKPAPTRTWKQFQDAKTRCRRAAA
jgi:outer membrane protein assembly factor BamD